MAPKRIYQDFDGRVWIEEEDCRIVEPSDIPIELLSRAMQKGPEFTENFIAAATPGGIERQERQKQQELVRNEQLPIKLGSPKEFFDKLGFKFGRPIDKMLQEGTLPEGWTKIASPFHSMYSYVLDQKKRARWTIFFKGAFYDYEAFGWALSRRYTVRVQCDYKFKGPGEKPLWGEVHDNGVEFDRKEEYHGGVKPKIVYRSREPFFVPKNVFDIDRVQKMIQLEMEMWIEANFPAYEDPMAYWD